MGNRLFTKLALLRLMFGATREQRNAIKEVRRNTTLLDVFEEGVNEQMAVMQPGLIGSDRPLMDFLQWVLDNREEILEFILTIVQLFQDTPEA
jgi:hypothetical protein